MPQAAFGSAPDRDTLDWPKLETFALQLTQPGFGPGSVSRDQWEILEISLRKLETNQQPKDILKLRKIFTPLFALDTLTNLEILLRLDRAAIQAARQLGDRYELGKLLGDRGHNLHRQGFHRQAIAAYTESFASYCEAGETVLARSSFYMTALCYRALGEREIAGKILDEVLVQLTQDDPWRANPLQVKTWLLQDLGHLAEAERLQRQVLEIWQQTPDTDTQIAGGLADLAELVGIQGRFAEACSLFDQSLTLLDKYQGQVARQEARSLLKYAELLMHHKDYAFALTLLKSADKKASSYGHYYDLLWQIELATAFIFLRQYQLRNCLPKIRSVFRYRKILGLSNRLLVWFVMKRYVQRFLESAKIFIKDRSNKAGSEQNTT